MRYKREQGQTIIIVAISLFVLTGMAALVIDGGYAHLNRRSVQTAADAGALAGAYERCINSGSNLSIEAAIIQYAVTENDATALESWSINADDDVEVIVTLTRNSFFARVFGQSDGTVRAKAAAGCFSPAAVSENLLPVAFACRPPEGEEPVDGECVLQTIPYPVMQQIAGNGFDFEADLLDEDVDGHGNSAAYQNDLDGAAGEGKMMYVVMDDDKFDYEQDCMEAGNGGSIKCDFNGDGVYDISSGAERGWLYLDGGNGASDLSNIIRYGPDTPATLNTWYPGKSGVNASVFDTVIDEALGHVVLIPVFDALCSDVQDEDDFETYCSPYDPLKDIIRGKNGMKHYHRVVAFAPFYVTCVSKNNDYCPGADYAGIPKGGSIEGYFVDGYVTGGSVGGEYDLGAYIISLTQ